jgi:hypothetical protein
LWLITHKNKGGTAMSRGRYKFKEADLNRAIRCAQKAGGGDAYVVRITPAGAIEIEISAAQTSGLTATPPSDEWKAE